MLSARLESLVFYWTYHERIDVHLGMPIAEYDAQPSLHADIYYIEGNSRMRKIIALTLAAAMVFAGTAALAQSKQGSNGKGGGAASGAGSKLGGGAGGGKSGSGHSRRAE